MMILLFHFKVKKKKKKREELLNRPIIDYGRIIDLEGLIPRVTTKEALGLPEDWGESRYDTGVTLQAAQHAQDIRAENQPWISKVFDTIDSWAPIVFWIIIGIILITGNIYMIIKWE